VYEGGIRVPTLLSWPAKLKPGTYNGVAQIIDWMPTLCALAEAKPAQDLKWDGLNLWPQFSSAEPIKPRAIYTTGPGFNARAVRDGDWKLIVSRKGAAKKDAAPAGEITELYDLATDPNETTDLAAKMPEKVASLHARMDELSKADRDSVVKD
jgi:arylsulfatase A-like enzyme